MSPDADQPREQDGLDALPATRSISRWDRVWRPFWVLPLVIVLAATTTGILLPEFDKTIEHQLP